MTLIEFLLTRIAEDEAAAKAATPGPWVTHDMSDANFDSLNHAGWWWVWAESRLPYYGGVLEADRYGKPDVDDKGDPRGAVGTGAITDSDDGNTEKSDVEHIARHDPVRVLAEVEAKRATVKNFSDWVAVNQYRQRVYDPTYLLADRTLRDGVQHLAAVYADHPDFDVSWRP